MQLLKRHGVFLGGAATQLVHLGRIAPAVDRACEAQFLCFEARGFWLRVRSMHGVSVHSTTQSASGSWHDASTMLARAVTRGEELTHLGLDERPRGPTQFCHSGSTATIQVDDQGIMFCQLVSWEPHLARGQGSATFTSRGPRAAAVRQVVGGLGCSVEEILQHFKNLWNMVGARGGGGCTWARPQGCKHTQFGEPTSGRAKRPSLDLRAPRTTVCSSCPNCGPCPLPTASGLGRTLTHLSPRQGSAQLQLQARVALRPWPARLARRPRLLVVPVCVSSAGARLPAPP